MNARRTILTILSLLIVFTMIFGSAVAEDGLLFRRNISKTPPLETAKAGLFMMNFYVPAQSAAGVVGPVTNYLLADATVSDYAERDYAKPLISVYIDGPSTHTIHEEESTGFFVDGGIIFGAMDAFAGVSLDDGTTWKTTNISRSADLSSFTLQNGTVYPGHVHQFVHQVFGDNIFMAWVSKYCESGTPLYSLSTEDNYTTYALYLDDLASTYGKDAVYLYDLFGVAGSQSSVDYTLQGFPEVGEIPYSCVWTARGKLLAGDDPKTDETEATYVMWTKAERLTSGARDANLPAVDCADAGCVLTWQEDPEGLRPGLGLGPGEGWSGAVANQQTDIWYSFISGADFDKVFETEDTVGAITLADYAYDDLLTTMPKPYVPMAMPVRLTDNAMCKADETMQPSAAYCYVDFDDLGAIDPMVLPTTPTAESDFCATQVEWLNPGGNTINLCVTEDGRLLNGRVAATRVRLNLKPYTTALDLNEDSVLDPGAWLVMAAEESKALGSPDEDVDPVDIGKDVWYYSFDPFDTQGTGRFMVNQGGILNQPAVCSEHDLEQGIECVLDEFTLYDDVDSDTSFYLTEIARRFALTTNGVSTIADIEKTPSGLAAMLIYKQGIVNQGGPADIFLRRVVIPEATVVTCDTETDPDCVDEIVVGFDPSVDNPYRYENMECASWDFLPGTEGDDRVGTVSPNVNYLQGICLSPAINISSPTIVECDNASGNDACADLFPVNDDGSVEEDEAAFTKVREWRQLPYDASNTTATVITDDETGSDLDDQSWENPFDVAKGHRGFLDGDYVMMMYAWAPNWKSNSVGNDHYNLYTRRSFDGGVTWTTTPSNWCGPDGLCGNGLTSIENYCVGITADSCEGTSFTYAAGAAEQGMNVSQLIGNKVTILDPRYSPTGGMKLFSTISDWFLLKYADLITFTSDDTLPYADDAVRDPSKYFMIYETGDNTTVAEGEAIPLDLFYSRATVYGDVWELDPDWYDEETGEISDYRWNWAEKDHDILSGEAAMLVNPGGTFMYAVWNQWEEEIYTDEFGVQHEVIHNSDMPFRRHMYLPDDSTIETAPRAIILAAPSTALASDQLTFIGSGLDADDPDGQNNIQSYTWSSSIDGFLGNGQILTIAADQLSLGVHIISLVVTDDEGVSSTEARTILVIAGGWFSTQLPMMNK